MDKSVPYRLDMTQSDPVCYFKTSREIIRRAVMFYVLFPLSHRNVEDLLHERSIDVSHEAVRFWWCPISGSERSSAASKSI
jgi:transposase-like protein